MLLSNIKTSRIPNRVNLIFSNGYYLPFFIDDLIRLSLVKNQEINPEKLEQIKSFSLYYLGKEYALRQIAISPKTEKILSQKLKIYFFKITQKFNLLLSFPCDQIISQITYELKEKNLISQSDYLNYYLRKNKSKSLNEIKFYLKQKGVDTSLIKLSSINDKNSIKIILQKKQINRQKIANFNFKNKLYASLSRKGFQFSDIKAAIDEFLSLQ